jgi:hypothetical protein
VDPALRQPLLKLVGIEPEQVSPLQVRDAPFSDKATYVPNGHAEVIGDLPDVEQPREVDRRR